jgi:hypothetical protein
MFLKIFPRLRREIFPSWQRMSVDGCGHMRVRMPPRKREKRAIPERDGYKNGYSRKNKGPGFSFRPCKLLI